MHGAFILHAICTAAVGSGRCGSSSTADVLPSLPPLLGKCTYLVSVSEIAAPDPLTVLCSSGMAGRANPQTKLLKMKDGHEFQFLQAVLWTPPTYTPPFQIQERTVSC